MRGPNFELEPILSSAHVVSCKWKPDNFHIRRGLTLSLIVSLGLLGPNNNLQFEARGSDFRNSEKRVRKMPSLGKKQPHAEKIMFYLRR